jgi:hypothetical protein
MLLLQCKNKEQYKVYAPSQANEFVWVYKPAGDYFFGPNTEYLTKGQWYDEWVANDHTFVKDEEGKWHIIGITHPLVESDPLNAGIHDGEMQVAILNSHAPEIFQDEDGQWYISSVEWPNRGVSVDKLTWVEK